MNISIKRAKLQKSLLLIILVLFILGWLISENGKLLIFGSNFLLFIFSYGLGIFFMLGDENIYKKFIQRVRKENSNNSNPLFLLVLPFFKSIYVNFNGNIPGLL